MPKLKVMTFYTNPDFAKAHPEAIRDFIEALLLVYRDIAANPKLVIENAPKYVPNIDAAVLPDMVKAYMDIAAWDINGGLPEEAVVYSLEVCQKAGSVPSSLKAADTYDLSYLNDVLKKIGRK